MHLTMFSNRDTPVTLIHLKLIGLLMALNMKDQSTELSLSDLCWRDIRITTGLQIIFDSTLKPV